jgi:hypothetical protein
MRKSETEYTCGHLYLYTYSIQQSPSLEANQPVLQLIKKFPAFYGTRKFITVLTSARLTYEYFLTCFFLHGEELLAPRPTPKLENHPLSAVRGCLFNIFAATLHIGGRSSSRNLRTRHAVVTGTHLSRP